MMRRFEQLVTTTMTMAIVIAAGFFAGGCGDNKAVRFCFGDGLCVEPDGQKVLEDGRPVCELDNTCGPTIEGDDDSGGGGDGTITGGDLIGGDTFRRTPPPVGVCDCRLPPYASPDDADGDCIDDDVEDANSNGGTEAWIDTNSNGCYERASCCDGGTCTTEVCDAPGEMSTSATDSDGDGFADGWDTDGDGIGDGCEDRNHNGRFDTGELNPFHVDTDCDGLDDGIEDRNQNGIWEPGESNPRRGDSDGDGILDGDEDRNSNGRMDRWVDSNGDGCFERAPCCDSDTCSGGEVCDEVGETDPAELDSDDDGIADQFEDRNRNGLCDSGETCAWLLDTDCDGLFDGREDLNRNGVRNTGETDPLDKDSDDDGLDDGVEDANHDGEWDRGLETNPLSVDTDFDGIPDGKEDANRNGVFDGGFTDNDGDGCYQRYPCCDTSSCTGGETCDVGGETDPRVADSDGDGISDSLEDANQDGECLTTLEPDPIDTSTLVLTFRESCAFLVDTDCDGLSDGLEDVNRNGSFDLGELDPRRQDTDFDGLIDGCPAGADVTQCEDKNNDGKVDPGESDPLLPDTDGDGLLDGCEVNFDPTGCTVTNCALDPLNEDTDDDGFSDGEEDLNTNCIFEPDGTDGTPGTDDDESDPRDPADPVGNIVDNTLEWAEFQACATPNLKRITFALSRPERWDYKVAFEVEKIPVGTDCPTGDDAECPQGSRCDQAVCVVEPEYLQKPVGLDLDDDGFDPNDPDDAFYGHVFQSPGVPTIVTTGAINRDVYGFVYGREEIDDLNTVLDDLRDEFAASAAYDSVVEVGNLTPRTTHDDLPNYRILFAQRIFRFETPTAISAMTLRNQILDASFIDVDHPTAPPVTLPQVDPVYGTIICPNSALCFDRFTVYVQAVLRLDQEGPSGSPVMVFNVAITQDDSDLPDPAPRRYDDRVSRLEDLTGGSALGRFVAETGKECDERPQNQAVADMLWVVDDSASMQQQIGRLQQAAADARAVLTANSQIVDFRTAMTTTNPSRGARRPCPSACLDDCTPFVVTVNGCPGGSNGECGSNEVCLGTDCVTNCGPDRCDAWLGCFKACPSGCGTEDCSDGACTSTGNACESPTLMQANGCASTGLDAECAAGERCIGTDCYTDGCTTDIDGTMAAEAATTWILPGGGGQFYFEDSEYLDCDSSAQNGEPAFVNPCCDPASPSAAPCPEFAAFYDTGGTRRQLLANAGFLSSAPTANCDTELMDLTFRATEVGSTCADGVDFCCPRLTEVCADGPTVLASQMCDLIRGMGGLPKRSVGGAPETSSARYHSAPEHGSRSARRLIESMMPALPRDYVFDGSDDNTGNAPCVDGECDPRFHLRLDCDTGPGCQVCDPRDDVDCYPVPLVTLMLSDEEDFWFKDDCARSGSVADRRQLPVDCRWVDGDPATAESCTFEYCTGDTCLGTCSSDGLYCRGDSDCDQGSGAQTCTNIVCAGFATGLPEGYDPDSSGYGTGNTSLKWRNAAAAQCAPEDPLSCVADPCPDFDGDETGCLTVKTATCVYQDARCLSQCNAYSDPSEEACTTLAKLECLGYDQQTCQGDPDCVWTSPLCRPDGAACTAAPHCSFNGQVCDRRIDETVARANCEADSACRWEPAFAARDVSEGCVNAVPRNDCLACKRLLRTEEAIFGADNDLAYGGRLVGFGEVGPVYAIAREAGKQGFKEGTTEDQCRGGFITWGRGDGNAYRDFATGTLGRTQNVCADSYRDFMELVVADIAVLSAPYQLSRAPIAATIKVGIAREDPVGSGNYDYFEVPRSSTQGFFYSATSNSIAFKSDPIDGECGTLTCSADGVIEQSEVTYARTREDVPRAGDLIFISYRFWRDVPCREECADDEFCARLICVDEGSVPDPCDTDRDCPFGYRCDSPPSGTCLLDCTPGDLHDDCVPLTQCPPCEEVNTTTGECEPIGPRCVGGTFNGQACTGPEDCTGGFCQPGSCVCAPPGAIPCDPNGVDTCGAGYACDESCICTPVPGCGDIRPDGTVSSCQAALDCCRRWDAATDACRGIDPPQTMTQPLCEDTPPDAACLGIEESPGPDCVAAGPCEWFGSTCDFKYPRCCLEGEQAQCFSDPETGESFLFCAPEPCTCAPECLSNQVCKQDPGTGGCACFLVPG